MPFLELCRGKFIKEEFMRMQFIKKNTKVDLQNLKSKFLVN